MKQTKRVVKDKSLWKWPIYPKRDGKLEYSCRHGIGHGGVHGCDGCCSDPNFPIPAKGRARR